MINKMDERKTFKSKWEETDEVCQCCNQVTKRCRGLTRQNVKNLFRRPTLQDLIILVMIALTLFGGWAYTKDIGNYDAILNDPQEFCMFYWSNLQHGNFDNRVTYDGLYIELENASGPPS